MPRACLFSREREAHDLLCALQQKKPNRKPLAGDKEEKTRRPLDASSPLSLFRLFQLSPLCLPSLASRRSLEKKRKGHRELTTFLLLLLLFLQPLSLKKPETKKHCSSLQKRESMADAAPRRTGRARVPPVPPGQLRQWQAPVVVERPLLWPLGDVLMFDINPARPAHVAGAAPPFPSFEVRLGLARPVRSPRLRLAFGDATEPPPALRAHAPRFEDGGHTLVFDIDARDVLADREGDERVGLADAARNAVTAEAFTQDTKVPLCVQVAAAIDATGNPVPGDSLGRSIFFFRFGNSRRTRAREGKTSFFPL